MSTLKLLAIAGAGGLGGGVMALGTYALAQLGAPGWALMAIGAVFGGAALAPVGARWRRLSLIDDATSLPNRRALFGRLAVEWQRAQRSGAPLAFVVVEVDDMREHNNRYGHLHGDAVLLAVGRALCGGLRSGDVVGRWGGDEFGIILPRTGAVEALAVAERVRGMVAQVRLDAGAGRPAAATISGGVAVSTLHGPTLRELVHQADQAMYAAKERGKNQVLAAV
ncbi:MAG TPA: GGDEF domain-containing protein [Roseiflexaceae bacterium]|nr:GGDEF domain-containing protein [Roseiflexaceae bacterium]